jgi:uncharacterized protein (DUF952 family)
MPSRLINGQNIEPLEDRLSNKYFVTKRGLILIEISNTALKPELHWAFL